MKAKQERMQGLLAQLVGQIAELHESMPVLDVMREWLQTSKSENLSSCLIRAVGFLSSHATAVCESDVHLLIREVKKLKSGVEERNESQRN